jgi:subtilisin-like proprotein convertase family protein
MSSRCQSLAGARRSRVFGGFAFISLLVASTMVLVAPASAATFSNPGAIAIKDSTTSCSTVPDQATASPFPSNVQVSGLQSSVTDVNVTLHGFSHSAPGDVRALLVGPHGQTTLLMHEAGVDNAVTNLTLTFDDSAAGVLPNTLVSGTFKPSQENTACGYPASLSFPGPAPAGPYGSALAGFNGVDPNGVWSLYVVDDAHIDTGSISGGWSLDVAAPPAVQQTLHKKKCKKKKHHGRAAAAKKKCKKKKRK